MNITKKKQLILVLILIVAGLLLFGANMLDDRQGQEEDILPAHVKVSTPKEKIAVIENKEVPATATSEHLLTQPVISLNFPEDSPSPFALLNDFTTNTSAVNSLAAPPLAPQIPNNMPVFSTDFELPSMPIMSGIAAASGKGVSLKAILYKHGHSNMAILDDGISEFIVIEGKTSPVGYVSKITANTVILDDRILILEI